MSSRTWMPFADSSRPVNSDVRRLPFIIEGYRRELNFKLWQTRLSQERPTGLAVALFLAKRGIGSRVVEKKLEPSPYSKAFGVNPRTLELLEDTRVTEQLLAQGWRMSAISLWQNNRHVPSSLSFYRERLGFEITFEGPAPDDIFSASEKNDAQRGKWAID